MAGGILCHPLQVARPEPHQCNSIRGWDGPTDVNVWWQKEGMELGKECSLPCQVPYYPHEPHGIWVPRPWSGSKVRYLLNVIRCEGLFTAVIAVRAHPDRYEKDVDAVIAFLSQYIDRKAPTPSVKVASIDQTRPAKRQKTSASHGTFRGKIELKKYSREEYDSMSVAQCQ